MQFEEDLMRLNDWMYELCSNAISRLYIVVACCGTVACSGTPQPSSSSPATIDQHRLPTGERLDPTGLSVDIGQTPVNLLVSPDSTRLLVLLNGYRTNGVQILDRASGKVLQTFVQRASFLGLAMAHDGTELFASGGDRDCIYVYRWSRGSALLTDSIPLGAWPPDTLHRQPVSFPSGLALSRDDRTLYVVEHYADSLAIIDVASRQVTQRVATGRYPYGVVVSPNGTVYVSSWGGRDVTVYSRGPTGRLTAERPILVNRHPSALLLNRSGTRLFIASASTDRVTVVDTHENRILTDLLDPPPNGPGEGSTPNALALSADGTRLFAAEADANSVAVFDLSPGASDVPGAPGDDRLSGRIPVGWYPSALQIVRDTLYITNAKGNGTHANPNGPQPLRSAYRQGNTGKQYTLSELGGTLTIVPLAALSGARNSELASLSARVSHANGWDRGVAESDKAHYPSFEHVIFVIKENRTYDQVFGDMPQGDGDSTLTFFPRALSPNHHALADRFGLFDRFMVNAEVSEDGHAWSMAAYATDYLEKIVQLGYSDRYPQYNVEGTNGLKADLAHYADLDDVGEPASGYLWTLAQRKGITFRNYGEFFIEQSDGNNTTYVGAKPYLTLHTSPHYAGFDLKIMDQRRMDVWLGEFADFVKHGNLPALETISLPDDHTAGASAGMHTPQAMMADNDLALGRMIDAISHSPYWKNTVVFVVEDDAQGGPDHVDSHRAPFFAISAYNHSGAVHRFVNTTDVIRTIEEILGLPSLSQFDHYGRALTDIWTTRPDLTPYTAHTETTPLDARNPPSTRAAKMSAGLDLSAADRSDDKLFNRVLWRVFKGDKPMPVNSK